MRDYIGKLHLVPAGEKMHFLICGCGGSLAILEVENVMDIEKPVSMALPKDLIAAVRKKSVSRTESVELLIDTEGHFTLDSTTFHAALHDIFRA